MSGTHEILCHIDEAALAAQASVFPQAGKA
jgi:hypothetical protein